MCASVCGNTHTHTRVMLAASRAAARQDCHGPLAVALKVCVALDPAFFGRTRGACVTLVQDSVCVDTSRRLLTILVNTVGQSHTTACNVHQRRAGAPRYIHAPRVCVCVWGVPRKEGM
jgi:hypothetical protein